MNAAGFSALEKVGIVSMLVVGYVALKKLLCYVYNNFIAARRIDFKAMGQWALITGSTDGIGKAYAKALARKGCNILLVSRNEDKLKAVSEEIEQESSVKTKYIVADFTENPNVYEHIEKHIIGMEIGILVNNVGVSVPYPDIFLDLPDRDALYDKIIKANIVSVTKMCAMIMPQMVERKKGVVVNLSSLSAWMPAPSYSVYAASKIFVDKLSIELANTYRDKGIIVQSIVPGPVATNMTKIHRATWMSPTPDDYVKAALGSLGKSTSTPAYGPHRILFAVVSVMEFLSSSFTNSFFRRTSDNIKKRALRKMAQSRE